MRRQQLLFAGFLLLLVAAFAIKGSLGAWPVLDANPDRTEFNSPRALVRLQTILGDERPHPVDSEDNDAVRARLVRELGSLGLQPEVTDDFVCNAMRKTGSIACGRVRNVLVTVGPARGRHVLLATHYDSTLVGPGASDAGIGVAALLETAFLLSKERLQRPVTFLFTEGEEAGLLGARAFLRHPLASRVDSLINLEARGVTGPAVMFETNRPNGAAVSAYGRAVETPSATSLSTDFYRMIPNYTDVTVFEERGWTSLNLAIIGNETKYHSPGDNLASLDPRSLQHMGDQTLALARDLANSERPETKGARVFLDFLGLYLIMLPLWLGLAVLAGLLLFFAGRAFGLGRHALPAAAAVTGAIAGSAALAFLIQSGIKALRPGEYWRAHPEANSLAVSATALLVSITVIVLMRGRLSAGSLRLAFWLIFMLLGGAISIAAPGASICFILPPIPLVAGLLLAKRWRTAPAWGGALSALLIYLVWGPILHSVQVLLDQDNGWMFAPLAAVILLPALAEIFELVRALPKPFALAAAALPALAAWIWTGAAPAYSQERKQMFGIEHVSDQQQKKARWMIVNDGAPLPPSFRKLGDFRRLKTPPHSTRPRWAAPAQGYSDPPAVRVVAAKAITGGRMIVVELDPNGAETIQIRGKGARLLGGGLPDRPTRFAPGKSANVIRCHGRSCDGARLSLLVRKQPVTLTLIGTRRGLPADAGSLVAARPPLAEPQYTPDSTVAVSRIRL